MSFSLSKNYIDIAKQDALNRLINERELSGNKMTARQREAIITRLREQYSFQKSFSESQFGGRISSQQINNLFQSAFVDLHVIYAALNSMQGAKQYRSRELNSKYKKMRGLLKRLEKETKRLNLMRKYPEYENVITFDFGEQSNRSTRLDKADITESGHLKLQQLSKIDHTNRDGCSVDVQYLNNGTTSNSAFGPELIIDNNPYSFWAGTVLTNEPIRDFPVEIYKDYDLNDQADYTAGGAVVSLEIFLDAAQWSNNLLIRTISKFPVNIIQASYVPEKDGEYREIPGFSSVSQNDNIIDISFEPIPIYKLKLLIEQQNYTQSKYHVPTSLINNNVFWQEVVDSGTGTGLASISDTMLSHMLSNIESMLEKVGYDYSDFENKEGMEKILELIPAIVSEYVDSKNHIYKSIMDKYTHTSDYSDIQKIEYNIGISDIQISSIEYRNTGHWKSKRMINSDGVLQAEINTTEDHPVIYANGEYRPASSIHYSLDFGRNITIPIVPMNSVDNNNDLLVKSEVLAFDKRNLIANTRFPVNLNKNYAVYGDNVKVKSFGIKDNDSCSTIAISSEEFNPNVVYTITYYPGNIDNSPVSTVNLSEFSSRQVPNPIVFNNTGDNNTILLPSFPYVEYSVINNSNFFNKPDLYDGIWVYSAKKTTALAIDHNGRVVSATSSEIQSGKYSRYLIDGIHYGNIDSSTKTIYEPIKVTVDGSKAFNITDYVTGEHSVMPQTNQTNRKFQFIQVKNKLIFNSSISNAKIEIVYNTKAEHIQLVAELFSNTGGSLNFTPSVDDASILLRSRFI